MTGVLPTTALLLTRNGVVQGHFRSYFGVAQFLGVSIDDAGVITFMGAPQPVTYSLEYSPATARNGWTKIEALKDWARCHMYLPQDYRLYRYLA